MLNELLKKRNLPPLPSEKEAAAGEGWEQYHAVLTQPLAQHIYGRLPRYAGKTVWREIRREGTAAGKAVTREIEITVPLPGGTSFSFPVVVTVPVSAKAEDPKPAFVFISFGYAKYYPMEELVDQDVIVAELVMNHVAPDREDGFTELLSARLYPDSSRPADGCGKIGMWAFAASRVADYLLSCPYVDASRLGVIGHSRLGKTALWAGANDTRFTHVFSNDSGCAGAALTRGKEGESFADIYARFTYWFCPNMERTASLAQAGENGTFDQHFLLASIAPRKLYVASAQEDVWADPTSEYLGCVAASPMWARFGMEGFCHPDRLPVPHDRFADGQIGYHLRPGAHFLSRYDWIRFCEFIKRK